MKSISDVSLMFGLTTRTLRYYEEIGLLSPERDRANHRIYNKRELAKIKLIERGKRYNFKLEEIKEMILLFDKDRTGVAQLERTIAYGEKKIEEIDHRIKELQEIRREIVTLKQEFKEKLSQKRSES